METPTVAICITKTAKLKQVGACVLKRATKSNADDAIEYTIELFDFLEESDSFAMLDSFFLQVGSCLCYFPDDMENSTKGDGRKLASVLFGKDIEVKFVKRGAFAKKIDLDSRIQKLTGRPTHATTTAEHERPFSYGCMECLFTSLNLMSDESLLGKYDFRLSSLNSVMRIDSAAAEAVNLLPRPDHPSQFGSIFGVLNRCKTKMGSRLLERWLRQPLLNYDAIQGRLDCVSAFKEVTVQRNQLLEGPLKGIPDIDVVLGKMQKKNAGLDEMFRMYVFSMSLPVIAGILNDMKSVLQAAESPVASLQSRLIDPIQSISNKFTLYQELVRHVIDMDQLPNLEVAAIHDESLMELKTEKKTLEQQINKIFGKARDGWASFADIKLEQSPQHGYIMRSTKGDDERQLRANNSSVRILSILKNGVHFTVPELESMADRIQDIDREYSKMQTEIVEKALETAFTYIPLAEVAAAIVAEVDVLVAFATAAALAPGEYVRPTILPQGSGLIKLQGARHPCVELMDNMQFIPNSYDLVAGKSGLQIVTGPNMGGKSTYIRGIGAIVLMAQVGSFVPCSAAEISIVDSILARVGAGDAVQKGVSTFMAEMLEASVILQSATKDSLIIIDELGRGTSTFDGFGLAWAISEYICTKIKCLCLFATHFHELTALANTHRNEGIVNKHVTAHAEGSQLVMLYSVQDGPCEESFGVHIASMAGFPQSVIENAKRKAIELETLDANGSEETIKKFAKVEGSMAAFAELPINIMQAEEIRPHLNTLFPPFDPVK